MTDVKVSRKLSKLALMVITLKLRGFCENLDEARLGEVIEALISEYDWDETGRLNSRQWEELTEEVVELYFEELILTKKKHYKLIGSIALVIVIAVTLLMVYVGFSKPEKVEERRIGAWKIVKRNHIYYI